MFCVRRERPDLLAAVLHAAVDSSASSSNIRTRTPRSAAARSAQQEAAPCRPAAARNTGHPAFAPPSRRSECARRSCRRRPPAAGTPRFRDVPSPARRIRLPSVVASGRASAKDSTFGASMPGGRLAHPAKSSVAASHSASGKRQRRIVPSQFEGPPRGTDLPSRGGSERSERGGQ